MPQRSRAPAVAHRINPFLPAATLLGVAALFSTALWAEEGVQRALYSAADPAPLLQRIAVMEYSLQRSSVTDHLSPERRDANQRVIERARTLADDGNLATAQELIARVGRDIYEMNRSQRTLSGYSAADQWRNQRIETMISIFPSAYEIAREKGSETAPLDRAKWSFMDGVSAHRMGRDPLADRLLEQAYQQLQEAVAGLRSGDLLTVSLPEPASPEGWLDAERRYRDWVYTTEAMIADGRVLEREVEPLGGYLERARAHYLAGREAAEREDWASAQGHVDRAYRVMEASWRHLGVEI